MFSWFTEVLRLGAHSIAGEVLRQSFYFGWNDYKSLNNWFPKY